MLLVGWGFVGCFVVFGLMVVFVFCLLLFCGGLLFSVFETLGVVYFVLVWDGLSFGVWLGGDDWFGGFRCFCLLQIC